MASWECCSLRMVVPCRNFTQYHSDPSLIITHPSSDCILFTEFDVVRVFSDKLAREVLAYKSIAKDRLVKYHARTEAHNVAITPHHNSITDQVVVDVGCGTGIPSTSCARIGAKGVQAEDAIEMAI